ncbi:hypothetical protein V6U81_24200 [Micromonospora sp. CPCC 205711]|uniref:hypothetical protein n=1 Tax=Micromonospora sp. CPCC 205547 TaxID=3122400 RepID=UPI002FF0F86F
MTENEDRAVDRRRLLRRAGTVAAGLAGTAAVGATTAGPAQAAPGDPVLQGQVNEAGVPSTVLRSSNLAFATLRVENTKVEEQDGVRYVGPQLCLTPAGDRPSIGAEMGSLTMTEDGTLWAASVNYGVETYSAYVRTEINSNSLVPIVPQRAIDTRTSAGRARIANPSGNLDSSGRLLAGKTIQIHLEDFAYGFDAVYGNLTVTGALQGGFVTIFPKPGPVPTAATINFQANQTLSNFFVSGATYSTSGQWISVYAQRTTHVIIDLTAFAVAGGEVNPAILPVSAGLAPEDAGTRLAAPPKPSWATK